MCTVEAKQGRADRVTDFLVLLLSQGETRLKQEAASVDTLVGGHLQALLEQREFEGKPNETLLVHTQGKAPASRVLLVGVGTEGVAVGVRLSASNGFGRKTGTAGESHVLCGGHALHDASGRHCLGDCPGDGGRTIFR